MGKIFIDHGIVFEDNASGLTVRGFHDKDDNRPKLVIPDFLEVADHPGLCPSHTIVNRINSRAFMNAESLQVVDMPETIDVIEEYAFCGCSNLKRVQSYGRYRSNNLLLEKGAFQFCSQLESAHFNRAKTFIAQDTFKDCTLLTRFSERISIVHRGAFQGCRLDCLTFSERNTIKPNSIEKSGVKKLIFEGEYFTIAPNVWNWIKRANIKICCTPNSNLANLAYEGINVEILSQ